MNDELNKEGASDSLEDEPASLRVENEINEIKTDASNSEEIEVSASEVDTENTIINEEKVPEDVEPFSSQDFEEETQE